MLTIPDSVRDLFLVAGWHPSRCVAVDQAVSSDHPAAEVLAEFGGLHVGSTGRGLECARSDINFVRLDDETIADAIPWQKLLETTLIGIAECHLMHEALLIAESGRCFGLSYIHDAFYFEGESFGEAVEGLLLGRHARPMLRPNQPSVMLYGETFAAGHPSLYLYGPQRR